MTQNDTWEMGLPETAALLTIVVGIGVIHSIMSTYGITFDRTIDLIKVSVIIGGIAGLGIGWQFSKAEKWWGIVAGVIATLGTVRLGWFIWAEMGWSMLLSAVVGAVIVGLGINGIVLALGLIYMEWQNRKRRPGKRKRAKSQKRTSTNSTKRARADQMKSELDRRERYRQRQQRYQGHVPKTTGESEERYETARNSRNKY
jgi:hypothetical protein